MKRFSIAVPAVALVVSAAASPAMAWNAVGHEAVAQIAWDQLNDAEKAKLSAILKAHPRYEKDLLDKARPEDDQDRLAFLQAACWPDTVRSLANPMTHVENHPAWHYIDYPYHTDGKTTPQPVEAWDGKSDPANLLQAMQKVTAEFKDPATKDDRRAIDICWVEHLTGDIHQPLHAVSLYSDEYPDGDKGGNAIMVSPAIGQNINLHAFWDGIEGTTPPRDYHVNPDVVRKLADRIEKDHPASEFEKQLASTDPKDWAAESFAIAKQTVYRNGKIVGVPAQQARDNPDMVVPPLPVNYETDGHKVADRQVALAGYRLAAELKQLLK
jgi:hypothetical protein